MKLDPRAGAAAFAVLVGLAWWGATSFKPEPPERARIISRGVPGAVPDQPGVPSAYEGAPEALAPVLRHAPVRPAALGADAQSPAPLLDDAAASSAAFSAARLAGGANAPGGSGGGSYASGAFAGSASAAAGAGSRGAATRAEASRPGANAPEAAAGDKNLDGAAGSLVNAARGLKARGDAAAMRAGASVEAGIVRGLEQQDKVDAGLRAAFAGLESSGSPVTPEAIAKAAEGVLMKNGLTPRDVDLESMVARAQAPPGPPVAPGAYAAAAKNIASAPPLEPWAQDELKRLSANPPPPRAPAPRGALDAFNKHEGVFDKALKDFGVRPEHILGILGVETVWGRNTGNLPLVGVLQERAKENEGGNPTKRAVQSANDLLALARLSATERLGGRLPADIKGSYAGAMGIPQFLPTSWEAYARTPQGKTLDPFDFATAAYSVGNYLRVHGYSRDVSKSIMAYNHSQAYVDKVLGLSADVKAGLDKAKAGGPAPAQPLNK